MVSFVVRMLTVSSLIVTVVPLCSTVVDKLFFGSFEVVETVVCGVVVILSVVSGEVLLCSVDDK